MKHESMLQQTICKGSVSLIIFTLALVSCRNTVDTLNLRAMAMPYGSHRFSKPFRDLAERP